MNHLRMRSEYSVNCVADYQKPVFILDSRGYRKCAQVGKLQFCALKTGGV